MAKYTVELYALLENEYEIGLDQYPIFDERYRKDLNKKICDHYYYREIGQETPDRFRQMMRRTMNEIMPYYNQLYKSELEGELWYDTTNLYEDLDRTSHNVSDSESNSTTDGNTKSKTAAEAKSESNNKTTQDGQTENTTSGTSTTDSKGTQTQDGNSSHSEIFQDTPAGLLGSGKDYATNKKDENDTSNGTTTVDNESNQQSQTDSNGKSKTITDSKGNGTSETTTEQDGTSLTNTVATHKGNDEYNEESLKHKHGRDGFIFDDLLKKHRENFLNIDMMIIEELSPLFLNLY